MKGVARYLEIGCVVLLLAGGLGLRFRIGDNWVFAGSDTYGYLKLAEQVRTEGSYALGPAPEPLHFARVPLYPLFLLAVKGAAPTDIASARAPGWVRIVRAQILLDVLGTGLLVFFLARRMAGPIAGVLSLAAVMFSPLTFLHAEAVLTECVGMLLTTATLAALVLGAHRPRRWFTVAGVLAGLGALLRPDGWLLVAAFLPAVLAVETPDPAARRREQLRVAGLAAAAFVLVFAPWPIRNLQRFGHAYPVGVRIDRKSQPVVNFAGFHAWMRSYSPDWRSMAWTTTCLWDVHCPPNEGMMRQEGAFDTDEEKKEFERLIAQRDHEGLSEAVSAGFQRMADARRVRHPFAVTIGLPVQRAWNMWVGGHGEIAAHPTLWPVVKRLQRANVVLSAILFLGSLLGGAYLFLQRRTRSAAAVLTFAIVVRTVFLAWAMYCMERYIVEVMPVAYALLFSSLVVGARALVERFATRRRVSAP